MIIESMYSAIIMASSLSCAWRCDRARRSQPENSPAATASAGSILLGDSLATLDELAGDLNHRQTGDCHQMAQIRLSLILAMEVEGSGRPSEDQQGDS
jgi:hypothetical protein